MKLSTQASTESLVADYSIVRAFQHFSERIRLSTIHSDYICKHWLTQNIRLRSSKTVLDVMIPQSIFDQV